MSRLLCVTLLGLLALAAPASAATPVSGFEERVVSTGFPGYAIGMDFAPDGRLFVALKHGAVRVVLPDGTSRTILDISAHVNDEIDRGLTGIAVDSQFATNRYVFLFYTYDPPGSSDPQGPRTSRVTRIQVNPDSTVVNARTNPETVILGNYAAGVFNPACPATPSNTSDCIPADGLSHVNGTVIAAPDGTLYVGTGDAMMAAANAPSAFRPYDERSMAGKILHITRNGRGVAGHPFCPTVTDLTQVCTKVYAKGFRNPFRFVRRAAGGLWAGDVGQDRFEEIDHVVAGASYGWPCYEGPERNIARAGHPTCQPIYAKEGTAGAERMPFLSYPSDPERGGSAIIVGPEYSAATYPADYKGTVFYGDFVLGFLNRLQVDGTPAPVAQHAFASEWQGADLKVGPDGLLYSANFFTITRFVPVQGNRAPVASATADPVAGLAPLDVGFDASGSTDPDGDPLTYVWDFGDGSPTATGATPRHVYSANGTYTATVTVRDPAGASATASAIVRVGERPPVIDVASPVDGSTYRDGSPVTLSATATDPEDGALGDAAIRWQITLVHDTHQHAFTSVTGRQGSFTPITDHDADSHYIVTVTATDSVGLTSSKTVRINPETVALDLVTDPASNAALVYGGESHAAPYSSRTAIGFHTTVVAPETITAGGKTLVFSSWSDGGARSHDIDVPAQDLRLVARYSEDPVPPETTITSGPGTTTSERVQQFYFQASEPVSRFDCQVDSGAWFDCDSPYTTAPLQRNQQHVFRVKAYDLVGNVDPTPAVSKFFVLKVG